MTRTRASCWEGPTWRRRYGFVKSGEGRREGLGRRGSSVRCSHLSCMLCGGLCVGQGSDSDSDVDAAAKRAKQLEEDLEASYHTYLSNRSDERMKGTRAGKRKKAAMTAIAGERIAEDAALYDGDLGAYVKLLSGKKEKKAGAEESDDSSSSEEEEEEERGEGSGEEEDGTDGESDEEEEGEEDEEDDIDDLMAPTGALPL